MPQLVDLFGYLSVLSRAGTLMFQSFLLGGVVFLLWIALPAPSRGDSLASVRSLSLRLLRVSAIGLAVVQGIALYLDSAVLMTTAEIPFRNVVGANFFVAGSCMLIAAIGILFITRASVKIRSLTLPLLVAIILCASVTTNHAAARVNGRPLLIAVTFLHEAAAGVWIGGLLFLIVALFRAQDAPTRWYLTCRFSRVALASVAMLLASGLAMSLTYIGSFDALFGTAYGLMVIAKAVMLGVLVVLGGINFFLLRRATPETAMPRLRRIVEAEFGIGITVILMAVSLTSQPPAVDVVNNAVPFRQVLARITPTWPRLTYSLPHPPAGSADALKAATQFSMVRDVDGQFLTYKSLADVEESEANHHWMGLIVLAMGILALLVTTGGVKWAEFWPLLLMAVSIFIFLRADTESWPFGRKDFWAASLNPEVFQHRLVGLFCAGFAIFEVRTRKRGLDNNPQALIFPMMCALGGAVLLTHSHSVTNMKEETLVELSHVPLGILAVIAGWSRWLEVRMPTNRRILSWIWPVCFVLIAAGLLNYREL